MYVSFILHFCILPVVYVWLGRITLLPSYEDVDSHPSYSNNVSHNLSRRQNIDKSTYKVFVFSQRSLKTTCWKNDNIILLVQ